MAAQGDKANWDDIIALYTKLNTARSKFKFKQLSPRDRQGETVEVGDILKLNNFITEMKSNVNLKNIANPVDPPELGELIKPLFLDTLSTTIDSIQAANNFGNSSFGNSSFSNSSFGNSSWGQGNADCWWL